MDDQYYILEEEEQQTGPYTLEELIERQPDIHTRILSNAENAWRDACDLPELYNYFREIGVYFPTADNLASFWIRLGAFIIDFILITFIADIIVVILASRGVLFDLKAFTNIQAITKMPAKQVLAMQVVFYSTLLIYNTITEASGMQGTLGKKACGLLVVNADGEGINIPVSLARSLGKVVSLNFWGLGFLSILWTEHRQGLHDYLAKTYVIRRDA